MIWIEEQLWKVSGGNSAPHQTDNHPMIFYYVLILLKNIKNNFDNILNLEKINLYSESGEKVNRK